VEGLLDICPSTPQPNPNLLFLFRVYLPPVSPAFIFLGSCVRKFLPFSSENSPALNPPLAPDEKQKGRALLAFHIEPDPASRIRTVKGEESGGDR
jgi:hypothetical protein